MSTARTGYDALEALTDGTLTDEERGWLSERSAESPDWAAAVKAHTPPDEETSDRMVDAILRVIDEEKVVELAAHPTGRRSLKPVKGPLAAVVAIAAGVALFTTVGPFAKREGGGGVIAARSALPGFEATREGPAMCSSGAYRGTAPISNGDCNLYMVRPATAFEGEVGVRAFDQETKQAIAIDRVERQASGALQVFVSASNVSRSIVFAIGAPGALPSTYEAAIAPSEHYTHTIFKGE